MIEIIKKGRDVKEFKCKICDTLFTYEEEDLVKIQPDIFTKLICLKCPNCHHTYKVKEIDEQKFSQFWEDLKKELAKGEFKRI